MTPRTPEQITSIAAVLAGSESKPYPGYDDGFDSILSLESGADGKRGDIVVVSDLHLGSGLNPSDNFTGNENFFADTAMGRFLDAVKQKRLEISSVVDNDAPMTLVINGDFIDFLRITDYPDPNPSNDLAEWLQALQLVGINNYPAMAALDKTITVERKEKYGLNTNDFKSVWKLHVTSRGHTKVFEALADWLSDGHRLILTKGNHDLELFWLPVRNYLRYILADNVEWKNKIPIEQALKEIVMPRITFIDNAVILDETFYVEPGHRYDKFTMLQPENVRVYKEKELNYPLGSFFNRYLIKTIEPRYPYFENVRPRESLLPLLIKTDFPLAIRIFFKYIPYLVRSIKRRQAWKIFRQVLYFGLALIVPLLIVAGTLLQYDWPFLASIVGPTTPAATGWGWLGKLLLSGVEAVGGLILSYYLSRLIHFWKLDEPSSLADNATAILRKNPTIQIVTLGHTHNPEQFMQPASKTGSIDRWFYNTGTWIPIVDTSTGSLREDKTYTYLYFTHGADGKILPHPLHRWDDSASRGETLMLMEIKEG